MKNKSILIPIMAVVSGAAIGAMSGLFIKGLPWSTSGMLGFRFAIPALFFLPLVYRKRTILGRKGQRGILWWGGILNLVRMVFYIIAFRLTTVGNAVVLLYLWPVFALIVFSFIKRKVPSITSIVIILAAFTGVAVMNLHRDFSIGSRDLYGSIAMILSAFTYSVTVFIYKKALADCSEGEVVFFQNGPGALVFLPLLVFEIADFKKTVGFFPVRGLFLGILYGLLIGVIAFSLFFFALKRISVFHYSIFCYFEVLFAVVFGVLILGEVLTLNQLSGMLIVVLSSFTAQRIREG